jgi:hypothetical protein
MSFAEGFYRKRKEINMKKVRKVMVPMILLVGVGAVVLMSASVWAKKGDGNATGTVTASSSLMDVIVKGNVDGGYLWLGFTLIYSDGYEDDKAAVEVKGNFKKSYTVSPTRAASGSVNYVASLWRWKIDKSECKADGCILCREKKCIRNMFISLVSIVKRMDTIWKIGLIR